MNMKRLAWRSAAVVALALLCAGVSACKKAAAADAVVGVLLRNNTEAFLQSYQQGLESAAARNGITLQIYSANSDAAIQIDQLKTLLLNGFRYFVIVPQSTDITEQMAKIISSKGGAAAFSNIIPSVETLKVSPNFFYASSPEMDAGAFQAQILDSYFKRNPDRIDGKALNLVYFNGEYGHPAQIYRRIGVMAGLRQLGYTVNVVGEFGANWASSSARQSLALWLEGDHADFDAVIAQNDEMALGAIEAMVRYGYVDSVASPTRDLDNDGTAMQVPVIGVDATEAGKSSMASNQLYGTVLQDANAQAETALELVWQCATSGSAQGFTTSAGLSAARSVTEEAPLTDGAVLSQCFVVPFVPVTR